MAASGWPIEKTGVFKGVLQFGSQNDETASGGLSGE